MVLKVKLKVILLPFSNVTTTVGCFISQVVNPIPEVTTAVPLPLPNGKFLPSFSFAPTSQKATKNSTTNEMVSYTFMAYIEYEL